MRIFLALVCLTFAASAQPATNNAQSISLQDAIQRALEHNLDLQIERYDPRIAQSLLSGAYGGYDPALSASGAHNFSLSGGGLDSDNRAIPPFRSDQNSFNSSLSGQIPWGLRYSLQGNISESYGNFSPSTRGAALVNLRQPLLKNFWIDSTRLNIRIGKLTLKQSELRLRKAIMDTVTAVELAYYDLIAARENVRVQEKALELAERLVMENKKRVEVGTLAPLDEKQAESQAAGSRAELIAAQQSLGTQENTFKSLISDDYRSVADIFFDPTESLTAPPQLLDLQDSWTKGMTQRPDLLQARLDVEKQGVTLKYNRNQLFPELDLTGTYGHSTGGSDIREFHQGFDEIRQGNKPFYSYGAQISFPLGNIGARSSYRISKMQMETILLSLKKLEQGILVGIRNAIGAARADYKRVGSTHEARLYAEAALEAEQKKLESGKSTSFIVLQLQRDLTAARSAEIQALASYNKALAAVAKEEASTLERNKIDINVK